MLEDSVVVNKCYILRERLGEDAFSEWWRASAIFVASEFLLRFIKSAYTADADRTQAFVTAARDGYGIVAPSIQDLVEIDRHEGRLFLASEYSGHKSLMSILDSGERFSVEHSCRLMLELAEGIDEFHRRRAAYGIITPGSVIVKRIAERIEEIKLLKPGYVLFISLIPEENIEDLRENWGYAAPELKRGEGPTLSGDIYSLGVLLFRLLAGKIPYGSRTDSRVKDRSAAPSHVAAALARRGIPRELTAIVVRALRKNPRLRYGEVFEFIADLRTLLDSRREERLRSGGSDPIADLATLNLKKANAGAREISRSLETVDYFRFLSEAAAKENAAEVVPLETPFDAKDEEAIRAIEDREAEGDEDDDSMSVEEILDIGYAAAKATRIPSGRKRPYIAPREPAPAPPPSETGSPALSESPFAKVDWGSVLAPSGAPPVRPKRETETAAALSPEAAVPRRPVPAAPIASVPAPLTMASLTAALSGKTVQPVETVTESDSAPENAVEWSKSGGSPEAIAAALPELFKRAAKGRGSFRFIENPGPGRPAALIANAIDAMRPTGFVVDLGALPPRLELGSLLAILRTALALAALEAGKRTRSALSRRLAAADPNGYLRAAPLGLVLGGENAEPPAISDDSVESAAAEAAAALLVFARKSRPLVLLARGTDSIGPSAHRFIMKAAAAAADAPVCGFMFFLPREVESWHVLSRLHPATG